LLCYSCLRETSRAFEAGHYARGHEPLATGSDGAEGGAAASVGASLDAVAHAAETSFCSSGIQTGVRTQSFTDRTLFVVHIDRF
jgi:hypothetical protein